MARSSAPCLRRVAKSFLSRRVPLLHLVGLAGLLAISAGGQALGQDTSPSPVDGDPSERDRRARELFNEGKAAYAAEDYRSAWARFREAYILSRRPALLYNIGQAADRLGQTEEALTSFRLYLRALPGADNAGQVRERIAVLEGEREVPETLGGTLPDEPAPETEESAPFDYYLHGGAGLGLYFASFQDDGGFEGSIRGIGLALDVGGGLPLSEEFVIGGLLALNYQPAPSFVQGDSASTSMGAQLAWGLGPELTYFLSPTDKDVYLRGALLLAGTDAARRGTLAVGTSAGLRSAIGAALVAGGGYETPLTERLSYGIAGRAALSLLSEGSVSYVGFSISALGTLSFR